MSILLFARVPEIEIQLDLTVSEFSFVLPTQQILTNVMQLSALGAAGLQEIRLPPARDCAPQIRTASQDGESAIHLSASSEGSRKGTLTLAALLLPAGTHVWLRYTEVPKQFRLSLKGTGLILRVDVVGPVRVGLSGATAEQIDFLTPTSILFQPASDDIDLDLSLTGGSQDQFSPQLSADNLAFSRLDQFIDTKRTVIQRVSTILSGTLYLESLRGQEQRLRSTEAVSFASSHGEIQTLRLQDDHITLNFHGRVRGMISGSGENARSLMPTYLEWLQARHTISLLWATTLYLFGLIIGALRWWGVAI